MAKLLTFANWGSREFSKNLRQTHTNETKQNEKQNETLEIKREESRVTEISLSPGTQETMHHAPWKEIYNNLNIS